jgi:hypothetical protein
VWDELAGVDMSDGELLDGDVDKAISAALAEPNERASVPSSRWDRKTTPKNWDRVVEHLGLTAIEESMLRKNGFVVSARHSYGSYGVAMHDIHQQELPLYVSADAVLQGLFRSHESLMMQAESDIAKQLTSVLEKMAAALERPSVGVKYPSDVAADADVYLTVARRLLDEGVAAHDPANQPIVDDIVKRATEAKGVQRISLFGRDRNVDFSFYSPRGPYLRWHGGELHAYFRAMVWLTRLELNLVSRGGMSSAPQLDTRETPREGALALVLADLAERAGVATEIASIDSVLRALAGPREDVSLADLARMKKAKNIALDDTDRAAAALRAEIGTGYARTVNYHVRPYVAGDLAAIASFFGVGMTPDAAPIAALSPKLAPRLVTAPEVAYLLGHDRALRYVPPSFGPLVNVAAKGRADLASGRRGPDLYATWLSAARGLSTQPAPAAALPAFMETPAFADSRVASAMTAYGQIRHAYVLHAIQVYDEGGCRIPDAWVEPAIPVYDAILSYAQRLPQVISGDAAKEYASELTRVVGALRAISVDEVAGRPLSPTQLDFLAMVAEYRRVSGYAARGKPLFNGWYPRLFAGKRDAFEGATFVSDFFTSTFEHKISYVGALQPRLGIFVVDVAGEPRVMVGPVTSAIHTSAPLDKRLDDDGWYSLYNPEKKYSLPWEASYVGDSPNEPKVSVEEKDGEVSLTPDDAMGDVVVETFDEHSATLARATVHAKKKDETVHATLEPIAGRTGEKRGVRVRFNGAVWPH